MFFIYFRVISHEFVLASLRNPFGFPMVFDGNPTHFIPANIREVRLALKYFREKEM